MNSSECTIRLATSPEDLKFAWQMIVEEEWTVANLDLELFYATDSQGFYIGEVGEEKVSHISTLIYGDKEFCFIGLYLVKSEHRKKGYGLKTWNYAWSRIPKSCKLGLDSVMSMAPAYHKKYGFETAWIDYRFSFTAKKVLSFPLSPECSDLTFTQYREANFESLFTYDTSVFGYSRMSFLQKLVTIQEFGGWTVSNESGEIVGYCIVKMAAVEKLGWILYPLYANNVTIAKALLNKAAEFVLSQSETDSSHLTITVPEVNGEAMNLFKSISPIGIGFERMFVDGVPESVKKNSKTRIYGMSTEVG